MPFFSSLAQKSKKLWLATPSLASFCGTLVLIKCLKAFFPSGVNRFCAPTRVWAMVQIPGEDKDTQNYQEDWPTRPRSRETRQNVVYNRYVGISAMGAIGPELIFEGNAESEETLIRKQLRAITRHTLAEHNDSGNTQLLGVKYDTWQ